MTSHIGSSRSKVVIAGAGPAGSTLAIRLARLGHDITLIERETFPRHKLCGEFISPECLVHFAELGVLDEMFAAGGEQIHRTRFSDQKGRGFAISSGTFGHGPAALGLSRSAMDNILLKNAKEAGVRVLEGARVTSSDVEHNYLDHIEIVDGLGTVETIKADLFVDATGRSRALTKLVHRKMGSIVNAPPLAVGFKAHFRGAAIKPGVCEIFVFPGGYGGLSSVENGLVNLCFLMDPKAARKTGPDPQTLLEHAVGLNPKAQAVLMNAEQGSDWLAVSINSFGRTPASPVRNLLAIGDAAAFIDPFTGSGMLMAFESSALLAAAVEKNPNSLEVLRCDHEHAREAAFARRLRICSFLRRAAFVPGLPSALIRVIARSKAAQDYLAGATRTPRTGARKWAKTFENQ